MVAAVKRTAGLKAQMHEALDAWSQRPTAEALMSLRGISTITAMTILAELGDLTRFDSPRQLVGFLGLAPSEYSPGLRRRQGAITKTGNGHVRRVLTEGGVGLSLPGQKDSAPAPQGSQRPGPGASDRLGGTKTAVRPICEAPSTREGEEQGGHGDRA